MSLKFQIITKDASIIAADTRVSTTVDGVGKRVNDNQHKIIAGNNFIIYFTGNLEGVKRAIKELFTPINNTIDLSNKRITKILQKHNKLIIEELNVDNDALVLGLSMTRLNKGKITEFKFMPPLFEAEENVANNDGTKLSVIGIGKDAFKKQGFELNPHEWWDKYHTNDLMADIRNFYAYFNSELYGGYLDIYAMHKNGMVANIAYNEKIDEKQNVNDINDTDYQINTYDVIMSGNIQWNTDSNPLKVLYAKSSLSAPTDAYNSYPSTSSTGWHKTYSSSDYFASYSYDGGKTWGSAIKVRGEDGADGSDANVPGYIKSTYIDFNQVSSPQIKGNFILGGEVAGGSFWDSNKSSKLVLSNDGRHSDMTYSRADGDELFKIYDGIDHSAMYLNGMNMGHTGVDHATFHANGTWDFSNATIKGLKVTFG